jgi:hypothetical protein
VNVISKKTNMFQAAGSDFIRRSLAGEICLREAGFSSIGMSRQRPRSWLAPLELTHRLFILALV